MHVGGISSELHFKHLKTNVLPRYNPKPVIQPELDSCNNQATIKKYTHTQKGNIHHSLYTELWHCKE